MAAPKSKKFIEYNGHTLSIKEWSNRVGISNSLLTYRLAAGWTVERALEQTATNGNNQYLVY